MLCAGVTPGVSGLTRSAVSATCGAGSEASVSSLVLVVIFLVSASAIWMAGVLLSRATDALDARLGLGSALGGLLLLALATNLPEVAITVTAATRGNLGLAVGNIMGGIAIQTVVLALLDARLGGQPLTHRVGTLIVVLEASIVVATLVMAIMATQLPASVNVGGVSPGAIAVVLLWVGGLVAVNSARRGLPWKVEAHGASPGRSAVDRSSGREPQPFKSRAMAFVVGAFALAAVVTLLGGIAIEESGSELADRIGLSGAVFGATFLAASTALPEISTGLASVKLGDNELAFSDIFGGNAFLPILFLLADLVSGTPTLPQAKGTDIWMAGLGVVLTGVYISGLLLRPGQKVWRLGPDSLVVVLLYAAGIVGLTQVG
jgi:cation:H+ antiporter